MKIAYLSNYLKIYFWQSIAFVFQFLSMFIVIPFLSKDPSIYGIYAVCISVTIFLNYADLGFLSACQKFAAESYAKRELVEEMKFIGFGSFILLIFTLLCSLIFLYFGFKPHHLIKELDTSTKIETASNLLIILAIFAPVTVLKRMVAMVFDIRLATHLNQKVLIGASFITISSVLYFFRNGKYEIVSYFLFAQSVGFLSILISILVARKKYNYKFSLLFHYIRFDSLIFKRAKFLAFSGLYGMFIWLIFYEIDQVVIGKFLGSEKVAIYSIAIVFATLFRNIFGILFGPFMVRANYFIGNGDIEGLKRFCIQLVTLFAPIIIVPTVALSLVSEPLILSWVGTNYFESINLAKIYALVFTLSFISYPANMYLVATEKLNVTYIIGAILPIVYWGGILLFYSNMGLFSFAFFKLLAIVIAAMFYLYVLIKHLNFSLLYFYKSIILPLFVPLLVLIMVLLILNNFLPYEKSKVNFIIVVSTSFLSVFLGFLFVYISSTNMRIIAKSVIEGILFKSGKKFNL